MLEYIKQQLQAMNPAPQEDAVQEQLMDEAVLDCAHLFQEFDDLTMNGTITNGPRQFANVDIPLADDIEITSVELNLLDNRVVDVPMDATVQESIETGLMKTFEDFYQEALESNVPRGRETQGVFEDRCYRIAEAEFRKYRDYVIQEGLFGFDKIPVTDPQVPTTAQLNCGTRKGNTYVVFLNVYFQVDKKNRITKKQLETIQDFQGREAQAFLSSELQKIVFEKWGGMCNCDSAENIWDHVSPCELLVPVDPADKYCTAIVFEFAEFDVKKSLLYMVTIPKGNKRGASPEKGLTGELKEISQSKIESIHAITKRTGNRIAQEAAEWKPRTLNRFAQDEYYQEGIDFGDADAPPSTDANTSSVSFGNGDAAPDANASGADANAAPPAEGDASGQPKEVADGNDVSKDIAEKVADDTQAAATDDGLSVDGVDDATADADVSDLDNSDAPTEEDVNADLGDVDENSADAGDEASAASDVDVDNMTPEELKAAAADKIEKMTFQQIKDFLNNGEGTTSDELPEGDEGVQEAFFLTRGNIGKELDIHLRKTLGVLNDSEMEIGTLCAKFRKQGKRLNYVVHKASKMTDVFNEGERKQLLKLNALLSDLMAMMRADLDPQGVQAVKRLIKAFVQQATGVAKLVEQKQPGKPVQEGFFEKRQKVSEADRVRQLKSLSPARMGFLKKKGVFDKIFGKTWDAVSSLYKKDGDVPSGPKTIITTSNGFQITEEQFGKLLKTVEENTKTDVIYMNWSKAPETVKPDASVIGGVPPYAPEIPVTKDGKQMTFILQINFAEIKSPIANLPTSGLLQLWINTRDDLYGSDNFKESRGGYKLIYYKDTSAPSKNDELDKSLYTDNAGYLFNDRKQRLISFEKTTESLNPYTADEAVSYDEEFAKAWNQTFPDNQITAREVWDILKKADDSVFKKYLGSYYNKIVNKIGGYPYFIQHDSRPSEFTKDNSMMLMQLESDEVFMWGDCGNAQIFIKLSDLKKSNFSKTFYDWQCY